MLRSADLNDIIESVESSRVARGFSVDLVDINNLIRWWEINQSDIGANPDVGAKCGGLIKQLKNYRNNIQGMLEEYKRRMVHAKVSYYHGSESDEFRDAERRVNELQRERGPLFDNAGHYFQAVVTRGFYEDDRFAITDMEVRCGGHDFDIEIADERGNRYCVEVWYGRSKLHHAMRENTPIMGVYNGKVHSYEGSVPDRFRDVASPSGAVSMHSKHDLPKVWRKLKQLPDDRTGFLVACREPSVYQPERWEIDFPVVPQGSIPYNKCIIVLNFDNSVAPGKRGTAFVVHNSAFKHIDVAKRIIQSLKFRYNQDVYDEKVCRFE